MYRLILVPLDDSPFSARAIPLALRIARHTGGSIELVHVHERVVYGSGAPAADRLLDMDIRRDMREKLEALRDRVAAKAGLPVTASFLDGEIASALQAHVESRGIDLVVMTTHGRGGPSRAWLGSVADALVRRLRVPILLARSRTVGPVGVAAPPVRRVLVALDGSPIAEEVLERALALGTPNQTEYLLFRVVTPAAAVPLRYPGDPVGSVLAYPSEIGLATEAARNYLVGVAERIRRPGVPVNVRVAVHTQPARAIIDMAHEVDADLVALVTHGHGSLVRVLLGSVADKVIRGARVPTLVYRPEAVAAHSVVAASAADAAEGQRTLPAMA